MAGASANSFALLGGQYPAQSFLALSLFLSLNHFSSVDAEENSPPGSPGSATKKKEASASQTTRAPAKSKGPASRGGRYYPRGGKTPRETDGQEEAPVGDESASKKG